MKQTHIQAQAELLRTLYRFDMLLYEELDSLMDELTLRLFQLTHPDL